MRFEAYEWTSLRNEVIIDEPFGSYPEEAEWFVRTVFVALKSAGSKLYSFVLACFYTVVS